MLGVPVSWWLEATWRLIKCFLEGGFKGAGPAGRAFGGRRHRRHPGWGGGRLGGRKRAAPEVVAEPAGDPAG